MTLQALDAGTVHLVKEITINHRALRPCVIETQCGRTIKTDAHRPFIAGGRVKSVPCDGCAEESK